MRPTIGLTTDARDVQSTAGVDPSHVLYKAYTRAVLAAGGLPVLLPPVPEELVPDVLAGVDGLVLTGGGDVAPERYGGRVHATMYRIDPDRDAFELTAVRAAAAARLPTLAVCRGMQVLNVAFGGTLYEDLPTEPGADHSQAGELAHRRHQPITVAADSRLAAVLSAAETEVNSLHHQGVRAVAPELRVVARAADGVVEALEHDDETWPLWAVQWHPEYLAAHDDAALDLFRALVAAASRS